ncbi:MAG: GNAT family N-acetyltransferase [Propionibacteriales bacterium]|nr:GNAT family N-acetyltransferase [Propionibacteriales bacterium]
MNLHFETLQADQADRVRMRAWFEAVRLGFHDPRGTDESFEVWLADQVSDSATLRGVWEEGTSTEQQPVATFASYRKTINLGADIVDAHLITDVTVRPTHRRQGILRRQMTDSLTEARDAGLPLAVLTVTEATIYGRFGYAPATFKQDLEIDTSVRFKLRDQVGEDPGRVVMMDPVEALPAINTVFADFHATTTGSVERLHHYQRTLSGAWDYSEQAVEKKLRAAIHHDAHGRPDGYVTYKFSGTKSLDITGFVASSTRAHLALWSFLASIDLVESITMYGAPLDDPLSWAMADRRGCRVKSQRDGLWFRVLDPIAMLTAREWRADDAIVAKINDPLGFADGTFTITTEGQRATVERTDAEPDVTMGVDTLGALGVGGTRVNVLARARAISGEADDLWRLADMADLRRLPYSATDF